MLKIKPFTEKILLGFILLLISLLYYSQKLIAPISLGSKGFVASSFGNSYFPSSLMQMWMVAMLHFGVPLYYNYLSLAIVSLFLSLLGGYVFLRNVAGFINSTKDDINQIPFSLNIFLIIASLLVVANPFITNNYGLGVTFMPFLTLSLASSSTALKFKFLDWRLWSLAFLTGFFLTVGYFGYILLPVYFAIIFILIFIPISYRIVPIGRIVILLFLSSISFFIGSGSYGFILESETGSLGGLFPFFRPLNLEHEYSLLSVSGFVRAISGLSFNVSFSPSTLSEFEAISIVLLIFLFLVVLLSYIFRGNRKSIVLFFLFLIAIILSLPYKNNIPIIGYIPISLISNHVITYNHLGETLSIFDANRFLLFPYWFLISSSFVSAVSIILIKPVRDGEDGVQVTKKITRRFKAASRSIMVMFGIFVVILVVLSTMNGAYSFVNFDKSSGTYAYVNDGNVSYNRILLFQNENLFYPGNIYPSYMEMQADIPDKPIYMNFLNMESSPLVKAALDTLPPASFIYENGSENFVNGKTLNSGYNGIFNRNENLTVGYPVFVLGSQYTFDQYLFKNYYLRTNTTKFESYKNTIENYGRFVYYAIPSTYLTFLNTTGGMIEINTDINILSPIENGTGYSFGISNASRYWPSGSDGLSFGFSIINRTSSPAQFGYGNPIAMDFNYSYYLSTTNAFSYNLEDFIPFQSGSVGNLSLVFYNTGSKGIYGFIDYDGYWYQSLSNYTISQIKYFYSQLYLTSQSSIRYNITISELKRNSAYKNLIPIYYDSPFSSIKSAIASIEYSDILLKGKDYSMSDLAGTLLELSGNATVINPAGYSIDQPLQGWYQVFSDGAAQSSYQADYIPPVIDPPVFGYGAYSGFAQSIVENSMFTVPINDHSGGKLRLELNLLFSPIGGDIIITAAGRNYEIDTFSNHSYYGWLGLDIYGNITKLTFRNINGVQSINKIVLSSLTAYKYFYNVSLNLLSKKNFGDLSNLPAISKISSTYSASPVKYTALIDQQGNSGADFIVEFSNPTYSDYNPLSTNSSLNLVPTWGSYPGILIHNITGKRIIVSYTEPSSIYYSGYSLYLVFQGVWIPFIISYFVSLRKVGKKQ